MKYSAIGFMALFFIPMLAGLVTFLLPKELEEKAEEFRSKCLVVAVTAFIPGVIFTCMYQWEFEAKQKNEWLLYVQAHECKVVERNVKQGDDSVTGWLCNDGVKYYQPKAFEE